MMSFSKSTQLLSGLFIIIITIALVVTLKPLPQPTPDNCGMVTGEVVKIIEGEGKNDILINLKGDKNYYYVNRGLERGLKLEDLKSQLSNNDITLYYIKNWSFLDPYSQTKHIARLDIDGRNIYNEMNE